MIKSIGLTITATFAGQVLAFIVDILIAGNFGTSWKSDAYFLALVIPFLIYQLFVLTINAVFVPSYVRSRKAGRHEHFFSTIANATFLLSAVTFVIAFFLSPMLIGFLAAAFTPEASGLTLRLTRILLVLVVTMPLAAVLSGRLNAHDRFFLPALGKSFNFITITVFIVLFREGLDVFALPAGFVAGSLLFVLALALYSKRMRLGYSLRLNLVEPGLGEAAGMVLPLLAVGAISYVYVFMERGVAARFPEGSVAALSFAFKLSNFPVALFILGAMSVILPAFSHLAADDDIEGLREMTLRGLGVVSFFIMPVIGGMAVIRTPLVSLLFERGAFSTASTAITSKALLFYVFGIFGLASVGVMERVFYALKEVRALCVLGIAVFALSIALLLVLSRTMGFVGIPLTFAIISTLHMLALLVLFEVRLKVRFVSAVLTAVLPHVLAASVMAALIALLTRFVYPGLVDATKVGLLVYLLGSTFLGFLVYMGVSFALRVKEVSLVMKKLGALVRRG